MERNLIAESFQGPKDISRANVVYAKILTLKNFDSKRTNCGWKWQSVQEHVRTCNGVPEHIRTCLRMPEHVMTRISEHSRTCLIISDTPVSKLICQSISEHMSKHGWVSQNMSVLYRMCYNRSEHAKACLSKQAGSLWLTGISGTKNANLRSILEHFAFQMKMFFFQLQFLSFWRNL